MFVLWRSMVSTFVLSQCISQFRLFLLDIKEFHLSLGTLYELDGMKDGPIKHGSTSPESLLQVLQKHMKCGLYLPRCLNNGIGWQNFSSSSHLSI